MMPVSPLTGHTFWLNTGRQKEQSQQEPQMENHNSGGTAPVTTTLIYRINPVT